MKVVHPSKFKVLVIALIFGSVMVLAQARQAYAYDALFLLAAALAVTYANNPQMPLKTLRDNLRPWKRQSVYKHREQQMVLHPLFCGECERPIKFAERSGRRLHKLCAQKRLARRYPSQHRVAALAYQRRHKEMGLCLLCPQKVFKANLCRKHYRMPQER